MMLLLCFFSFPTAVQHCTIFFFFVKGPTVVFSYRSILFKGRLYIHYFVLFMLMLLYFRVLRVFYLFYVVILSHLFFSTFLYFFFFLFFILFCGISFPRGIRGRSPRFLPPFPYCNFKWLPIRTAHSPPPNTRTAVDSLSCVIHRCYA